MIEREVFVNVIVKFLGKQVINVFGDKNKSINQPSPIDIANEKSLSFLEVGKSIDLLKSSKAPVVICNLEPDSIKEISDKTLIVVKQPKLAYIKVLNKFFAPSKPEPYIHPNSIIHPEAEIGQSVYIGPFCCIGKSKIKKGCILKGNIHVYDDVQIGKNVIIHAGCVIGSDGFGYKSSRQKYKKFPQLGGVIIEDNVEIMANVNIARGTLINTFIGEGTKIDANCHIAHNNIIGKNNLIAAGVVFAGSVKLGNQCFIGVNSCIRDWIKIGNNVIIGMGSVVTKNISSNTTVIGSPARPINHPQNEVLV